MHGGITLSHWFDYPFPIEYTNAKNKCLEQINEITLDNMKLNVGFAMCLHKAKKITMFDMNLDTTLCDAVTEGFTSDENKTEYL